MNVNIVKLSAEGRRGGKEEVTLVFFPASQLTSRINRKVIRNLTIGIPWPRTEHFPEVRDREVSPQNSVHHLVTRQWTVQYAAS
jgi:hypothetical protein